LLFESAFVFLAIASEAVQIAFPRRGAFRDEGAQRASWLATAFSLGRMCSPKRLA
jgi:hypothetical protein